MNKVKKITATLLSVALALSFPLGALAKEKEKPTINLQSPSAVLYNVQSGEIVFEKNSDKPLPTASLTKIMTMALASEDRASGKVKNKDMVKISKNAWAAKLKGSMMFLEVGREFSFEEIMKGMAVVSGNDAAIAMAEHLNGTTDNFIQRMNDKASQLGMKNTEFITVNGYPKNGSSDTSTAKDMAILSSYYLKQFPENEEIHQMKSYTTKTGRDDITQANRNDLLENYSGAKGLKTGYVEGHYNIVASAEREGIEFIAVVMGAPSSKARTTDAKKLLNYGFSQYKRVQINQKGEFVETLPVYYSPTKKTKVVVSETLEVTLHKEEIEKLSEKIDLPKYIKAPLKKNEKIGTKKIYIGEELIYSVDLIVEEEIESVSLFKKPFHFVALVGMWIQDKIFEN